MINPLGKLLADWPWKVAALAVALLIFYSAISLFTILIVDISYGIIDPRIRIGEGK